MSGWDKFPCVKDECIEFHKAFNKTLEEDGFILDDNDDLTFKNCDNCGIEVCGNHSTAVIMWYDDDAIDNDAIDQNKHHEMRFNPPRCKRCMWDSDNNGEFGREPGWRATRGPRP